MPALDVQTNDVTVTLTAFEDSLSSAIPKVRELSKEEITEQLLSLNDLKVRYNATTRIVFDIEL